MRARSKWLIGSSILAVIMMIILLLIAMRGAPPPIPHPPAAAFTSFDNGTEDSLDLVLAISAPTDPSSIGVYLSLNGTNSWAHAPLSPAPATVILEDGREFALTHDDKDADGMIESGDHITIAGPFDGAEYCIALVFEPAHAIICQVITPVN